MRLRFQVEAVNKVAQFPSDLSVVTGSCSAHTTGQLHVACSSGSQKVSEATREARENALNSARISDHEGSRREGA